MSNCFTFWGPGRASFFSRFAFCIMCSKPHRCVLISTIASLEECFPLRESPAEAGYQNKIKAQQNVSKLDPNLVSAWMQMENSAFCAAVQYVSVIRAEADPNEDETRAPGSRRWILLVLLFAAPVWRRRSSLLIYSLLFSSIVTKSTCRLRLEPINKVTHQMHVAPRSGDWIRRNYTENAASHVCVCVCVQMGKYPSLEQSGIMRLLLWWRENGNFPSNRHKGTGKSGNISMSSAKNAGVRFRGWNGGNGWRLFCSRRREVTPTSMMDAVMAFNKYSSR